MDAVVGRIGRVWSCVVLVVPVGAGHECDARFVPVVANGRVGTDRVPIVTLPREAWRHRRTACR